MTASQIAFKAADYLAEHGHCKGTLEAPDGRVCLEGAIRRAAFGQMASIHPALSGDERELWEYLTFLVQRDYPDLYIGPVSWNDDIATGGEDVILLLKRAGRELEETGR